MPASNKSAELFIGLMSGTSLDGVDGVLVEFNVKPDRALAVKTLSRVSNAFPPALRTRLIGLQQPAFNDLELGIQAGLELAGVYARVIDELLIGGRAADVLAVGAHGQTVRHRPQLGYTIQLISGSSLAEACGIDVICDFRSADMAAGGQGAPLVPGFHQGVFAHSRKRRAIINIGGIANVSLLAPGEPVRGFDTGPGNTLLDAWIERQQSKSYDAEGLWAGTGRADQRLLRHLLADDYFARAAPKSTHRDYFTLDWLAAAMASSGSPTHPIATSPQSLESLDSLNGQDVQATLAELTAQSIASAVSAFAADEAYVCGGGAKNDDLMVRLARAIAPVPLATTFDLGIDPQSVEALAFAWLARQRVRQKSGNEPRATGASGPRVLGAWYQSSSRA